MLCIAFSFPTSCKINNFCPCYIITSFAYLIFHVDLFIAAYSDQKLFISHATNMFSFTISTLQFLRSIWSQLMVVITSADLEMLRALLCSVLLWERRKKDKSCHLCKNRSPLSSMQFLKQTNFWCCFKYSIAKAIINQFCFWM